METQCQQISVIMTKTMVLHEHNSLSNYKIACCYHIVATFVLLCAFAPIMKTKDSVFCFLLFSSFCIVLINIHFLLLLLRIVVRYEKWKTDGKKARPQERERE